MIFAANWKMHKTPSEAREFLKDLSVHKAEWEPGEIVVFPSPVLSGVLSELAADTPVEWGAQNAHWQPQGPFTGETSPVVLKEMGAQFCLLGHSERRQLFHETDHELARKVQAVQAAGLTPVLCVGETLDERNAGETEKVLERQLRLDLEYGDFQKPLWIAYEPVWAIGTGQVATPETVAAAHGFIRQWLKALNPDLESTPILYGGSVKPDNAGELSGVSGVDGFLIGGASLKVEDLIAIVRAATLS